MEPQSASYDDKSIKELINQAKLGDQDAFGKVYDLLAGPVYKYIYVRTLHKQIAEDLLSLTFLKAWQNLRSYKAKSQTKFSTWLFQISRNTIIDYYRGQKWEVDFEEHMNKKFADVNIEQEIDSKLSKTSLFEAVNKLSENYQTVLTLRFINQFSVGETAEIMSKTNEAVRSLQLRAIKALRQII